VLNEVFDSTPYEVAHFFTGEHDIRLKGIVEKDGRKG